MRLIESYCSNYLRDYNTSTLILLYFRRVVLVCRLSLLCESTLLWLRHAWLGFHLLASLIMSSYDRECLMHDSLQEGVGRRRRLVEVNSKRPCYGFC